MPTRALAAAVLVGCAASHGAPEPQAAAQPEATTAAGAPALPPHMRTHFAVVSRVQDAVVRGQLDAARWHARWLLDHDEPLDEALREGAQPFIEEMRTAARGLTEAADLPAAAALTAQLGRTCSRCHEARSAMVAFAWEPVPGDDPAPATQRARHTWAAARMWEGLIAPSDEMWREGADALASARLDGLRGPGPARADLASLTTALHDTAGRARQIADHDQRGVVYGELLAICARCHDVTRGR